MTDVTGIRNARVAIARRFDAPPAYPGLTLGGVPFPEPRAFGRSYANRTVPIRTPKSKAAPRTYRTEGMTFKIRAADVKGITFVVDPSTRPADAYPIEPGSSVSMRMFDFHVVEVRVSRLFGQCAIHVDFIVPERVTGKPLKLTYNHAILPNATKHYMAEQTAIALANAFQHEVRERLYLGSKHFIDPHPEAGAHDF